MDREESSKEYRLHCRLGDVAPGENSRVCRINVYDESGDLRSQSVRVSSASVQGSEGSRYGSIDLSSRPSLNKGPHGAGMEVEILQVDGESGRYIVPSEDLV